MNPSLHIVCLDAPAPPDYGGAIDMYYKIKALAETGKKITLHYFDYHHFRNAKELAPYCEAIYAYERKRFFKALPVSGPYIVQSRISEELINRLNQSDDPILLEGLHCTGILPFLNEQSRVVVRMHNEEASYYHHLAQTEKSFLKKAYFQIESSLLKKYTLRLNNYVAIAAISATDIERFEKTYGFANTHFIPCFLPWQSVSIKEGKGHYCLYHGNLSVSENEEAALWLVQNVFSQLTVPFRIAGSGLSERLKKAAASYSHITLINNPSIHEINSLVSEAQVNVLPSMNVTGVKLKLLNALLNGRHCITNHNGIAGSGITEGVVLKEKPDAWAEAITGLMSKEFLREDVEKRRAILSLYNNIENAQRLSALW